MLALKIIGGILLFFVLLSLLRVGCRVEYGAGGLILYLKAAFFQFQLIPARKDPEQAEARRRRKEQKKKRKARKKRRKDTQPEDKRTEAEAGKKGDLKWLLQLVGPALKALERLRRKVRVDRLEICYSIGGAGDPAVAAVRYGKVSAGGGALLPLLDRALDVREWDVDLGVDFQAEQSRVSLCAVATYRIGQLVCIMFALGISALSAYMKHQNQSKATKEEVLKHGRKASDR